MYFYLAGKARVEAGGKENMLDPVELVSFPSREERELKNAGLIQQ
jgi:hypothetical protein